MMPSFFKLPRTFAVLLGILAAGTLTTQVLTAGPKTTATETALFSVLQFVFSVAFAWLLTGISARRDFTESQKAFAIAAYRRINEIDEGVERLISRAQNQIQGAPPDLRHELEVVIAIAIGVRSSIKSSVADWGDVIGDEISTINRIERIQDQQIQLAVSPTPEVPTAASRAEADDLREQLEKSNEQISQLLATLPPALRVLADKPKRPKDPVEAHLDRLRAEADETSTIRLRGFWDPTLERDVRSMNIGDQLTIKIGTVGSRALAVCARDQSDKTVGIIINNGAGPYYVFRESLIRYFDSTSVPLQIVSIDARNVGDRHYFEAVVCPTAFAERRARIQARSSSIRAPRHLTSAEADKAAKE